ncbi:hypothetical protein B0H10DRAFT_2135093 [Mycena sp. CBHHK59/15]|nr:hypothetical protein B0H10DRAFT_2135093 [Mycena sp. CBHHK59/15]
MYVGLNTYYKTRCTTQKNYMDLCMLKPHTPTRTRQIEACRRRGGNAGQGILVRESWGRGGAGRPLHVT